MYFIFFDGGGMLTVAKREAERAKEKLNICVSSASDTMFAIASAFRPVYWRALNICIVYAERKDEEMEIG